jgi:hypothetical protein
MHCTSVMRWKAEILRFAQDDKPEIYFRQIRRPTHQQGRREIFIVTATSAVRPRELGIFSCRYCPATTMTGPALAMTGP